MTSRLLIKPNQVLLTDGTTPRLDTGAKHVNRITSGELTLSSYTITFPTFNSSGNFLYFYQSGTNLGIPYDRCTSLAKVPPQEWSNAAASPYTLPDILLGSLPIGTDYIEVNVNLARTKTPPALFGGVRNWPLNIIENKQMLLLGGSCLIERMQGMKRLFDVVKVDTVSGGVVTACNAYLRRKMSVTAQQEFIATGGNGIITHQLGDRFGNGNQCKQGQSNGCPTTNNIDYESTYTGTIVITPCRYL